MKFSYVENTLILLVIVLVIWLAMWTWFETYLEQTIGNNGIIIITVTLVVGLIIIGSLYKFLKARVKK